jgi:hypothetical protein
VTYVGLIGEVELVTNGGENGKKLVSITFVEDGWSLWTGVILDGPLALTIFTIEQD